MRYTEPNDAGGDADKHTDYDYQPTMPERDPDDNSGFQEQGCFYAGSLIDDCKAIALDAVAVAQSTVYFDHVPTDAERTQMCNGFYSMGGL